MPRVPALSALLALVLLGCGASDADQARSAARGYVQALGKGDGRATCGHMTRGLQERFRSAVTFANPGLSGDCPKLMQAALDSLPGDTLSQFATARITGVKAKGETGSFTYTLRDLKIAGKVAKEGGAWKVSCCVPGQDG